MYFKSSLGANGLLDLSKTSSLHRDLLGEETFSLLQKKYPSSLEFIDVYKEIADVTKIEKCIWNAKEDIGVARALAHKRESTSKGLESTIYDMYAEYLKILQYRKKVFRSDVDVTEGDYAIKVLGPLLESLMRDDEEIRLKWRESGEDPSEATESRGFKVDIRAVYDRFFARKSLKEADLAIVDMARTDAPTSKMDSDRVKHFIENKCVVDSLLAEGVSPEKAIVPRVYSSIEGYP